MSNEEPQQTEWETEVGLCEDARNSEPGETDIEHEEFVTAFLTDR